MDIEQFKILVDAMKAAGDGAFTFGLLWLGKDFVLNTFELFLILFLILSIYKIIKYLIDILRQTNAFLEAAGYNRTSEMTDKKAEEIVRLIEKGLKEES